jgi:hypothetical protein
VSHVGFGLVMGEDGKKFKTRSGDVVRLVELLDEAKSRCRDSIKTRREEVRTHSRHAARQRAGAETQGCVLPLLDQVASPMAAIWFSACYRSSAFVSSHMAAYSRCICIPQT